MRNLNLAPGWEHRDQEFRHSEMLCSQGIIYDVHLFATPRIHSTIIPNFRVKPINNYWLTLCKHRFKGQINITEVKRRWFADFQLFQKNAFDKVFYHIPVIKKLVQIWRLQKIQYLLMIMSWIRFWLMHNKHAGVLIMDRRL